MKALILTLLLFLSCTRYSDVTTDAMGTNVQNVKMDISYLNEIEWKVGKRREEKISQSITFMVEMPKIREKDLDFLMDKKGVDAWILRLIFYHDSKFQDLGSLYTLFKPQKFTRGQQSGTAATNVSLKVYYAAAYASERFRAMKCPPFGHNKKIEKMEIRGEDEEFTISIDEAMSYPEKSHLVELTPSSFNAGHSLVGEYFIEIAPYDSKKRMILSNFKRLPRSVAVIREKIVKIKSCEGAIPEERPISAN